LKIKGQYRHGIVRWEGTEWVDVALGVSGPGTYSYISSLAVHQDQLIVGGPFWMAGGNVSSQWARYGCPPPPPCLADCDENAQLNIDDFICFQTNFVLGEPAADCDANAQLNIDDFICFQTFFVLGC
jgi:hypothetical protein